MTVFPLGRIERMTQRSGHQPAEQDAIRAVAARLTHQLPELPPAEIEQAVYGRYERFEALRCVSSSRCWSSRAPAGCWPNTRVDGTGPDRFGDPARAPHGRGWVSPFSGDGRLYTLPARTGKAGIEDRKFNGDEPQAMATKYRIRVRPRLALTRITVSVNGPGHQTLPATTRLPRPAPADVAAAARTRSVDGQDWLAGRTPKELAGSLLRALPDRWAHTQTAAAQAEHVALAVPACDRDLLIAAAWRHDIGYAAQLDDTGFHPLDGARYLWALADRILVSLRRHAPTGQPAPDDAAAARREHR